ncbi:hypothetical protein GCM10010435_56830 [Winogradskya consettensis]|uniref:Uncharacterized protein n=1 Tax=Winogradskya consettensis TaxID=113560 RepID=A0A919S845_9ACTN|nr:hypothetical protein [Actinoplanes consettensis]GIM67261.1 hypothetical protein Aco04nite_05490 [Actinoplanes consettensis]
MHRRRILLTGLAVSGAELIVSIFYPVPIYATCGGAAVALLIVGMVLAWRRNRHPPAALLLVGQSFRTPRHLNGVFMGLSCLQLATFSLAATREGWQALLGVALFGGMVAVMWRSLWRGHGLILRPSGIEAAKSAGTLTIPWEALAAEQPGRGPVWHEIKLAYAHPELVTMTGWTPARGEIVFEGVDPDFMIKTIAAYAAEPDRRAAIGTPAELERLREGLPPILRGIAEIVEPAPARVTVRRIVLALACFVVAAFASGWLRWLSMPLLMLAASQSYYAFKGWRAAALAAR